MVNVFDVYIVDFSSSNHFTSRSLKYLIFFSAYTKADNEND